jgi:hypothetical protein
MRTGKHLSPKELLAWVHTLVIESGEPKKELAAKLGVSAGALTRATTEEGAKWFQLQIRIVELLTQFTVHIRLDLIVGAKDN